MKKLILKIAKPIIKAITSVPGLEQLGKSLDKVISLEVSSAAGLANIGVGILGAFVILCYFIIDLVSLIISKWVSVSLKPSATPEFLLSLVILLGYGVVCVTVLKKETPS